MQTPVLLPGRNHEPVTHWGWGCLVPLNPEEPGAVCACCSTISCSSSVQWLPAGHFSEMRELGLLFTLSLPFTLLLPDCSSVSLWIILAAPLAISHPSESCIILAMPLHTSAAVCSAGLQMSCAGCPPTSPIPGHWDCSLGTITGLPLPLPFLPTKPVGSLSTLISQVTAWLMVY